MGCLGFLEVVARSAFHRPTPWSLPISQYLLLTVAFIGTGYCLQADGHINIELLVDRLRGSTRKGVVLLGYALSIVYVAVALYYTLKAPGGFFGSAVPNRPPAYGV
ncbi:MAG: TRAP transporter small permease [Clostridia bacterium]|jgi:TRAP-type C4-dicarboxylate transport system permease small subunit|nr:TRAP transporter small permease [Clostridia bacterium]MDH7573612.1 TRAP transporter small permease [Clostridia bacterium]